MEKELIKTVKLLNKHKIKYMLIGGYAVILYGVQRTTFDIDIAILLNHENIKKTIALLSTNFRLFRVSPEISGIDPHYGNILYQYHVKYHYKDTIIKLPNIADLINIKESSARFKDIEDATTLRNIASLRLRGRNGKH